MAKGLLFTILLIAIFAGAISGLKCYEGDTRNGKGVELVICPPGYVGCYSALRCAVRGEVSDFQGCAFTENMCAFNEGCSGGCKVCHGDLCNSPTDKQSSGFKCMVGVNGKYEVKECPPGSKCLSIADCPIPGKSMTVSLKGCLLPWEIGPCPEESVGKAGHHGQTVCGFCKTCDTELCNVGRKTIAADPFADEYGGR